MARIDYNLRNELYSLYAEKGIAKGMLFRGILTRGHIKPEYVLTNLLQHYADQYVFSESPEDLSVFLHKFGKD